MCATLSRVTLHWAKASNVWIRLRLKYYHCANRKLLRVEKIFRLRPNRRFKNVSIGLLSVSWLSIWSSLVFGNTSIIQQFLNLISSFLHCKDSSIKKKVRRKSEFSELRFRTPNFAERYFMGMLKIHNDVSIHDIDISCRISKIHKVC